MRIALVASSYLPDRGRLERRVAELARGLAQRGAEVEILTQGLAQRPLEQQEGVTIRRYPTVVGPLRFAVAPRLRDRIRVTSRTCDVVDVHTRHLPLAVAVANTRVEPLVLTPGGPMDVSSNWRHATAMNTVIEAAAQIVCPSEIERDLVCSIVPGAERRTQVLPDGIDVAALTKARPFATDEIVVLSVDRLDHATSVGRAIAAVPGLDPEFRLVIVGDGPARARLSAFAADLQISSRVQFVGAVSDELLYRWLRSARVVVTLARDRGSGSLLAEARAAGVAVVASDLPIHRLAAERPGLGHVVFVSPRGSPIDVADAIEEAARLPTRSNAALLSSSTRTWETVVASTWKLYRRLLGDAVDSEPEHASSEVVDLTAQLQAGRQSVVEPEISTAAGAVPEPANGRGWWQNRRRYEDRANGARRWH
ncbi:MAG: glycosyltransferase family 4 protein [Solirubrobacterales bacterium]|nr:glycosyltransferase family 4 protein [Solirubrobacterales bacterium]